MKRFLLVISIVALFSSSTQSLAAGSSFPPDVAMIDQAFIAKVRGWANSNVVHLTVVERNHKNAALDEAQIIALDKQWRAERKITDQPLITGVLSNPLSGYLTRIQAGSLGLYTEIFVMDAKGLNAGQSAITSDYWQGDEAKWQKTFLVAHDAVFIDEPEFHEKPEHGVCSSTWPLLRIRRLWGRLPSKSI